MSAALQPLRQDILLVEPSSMTGGIIVSTARQLALPPVRQVNSVRSAHAQLNSRPITGMIVSLEEAAEAVELLRKVRAAEFPVRPDMPIAITTAQVDSGTAEQLKALRVRRILLKPFKVHNVITTIEMLVAS